MAYVGTPGGLGMNGKSIYSNVAKLCELQLQFTVTPTNGLGVTSLKSNGYVNNVFMHTSTTPAANNGFTNPNPADGYAWIQLKNNFNYFLSGMQGFISANSGSDVKIDNSAMTAGQAYTITTLGNATLAKWQAIGVPVGVTPAVGVSFVALSNGGAGNTLTSRVQVPSNSGISHMEIIGNPNTMVNSAVQSNAGQWVMVQFLGASVASVFTGSALGTHTHDFTVIGGQAASTSNNIANYAGPIIGKEEATNATYVGADSATNGGVVAASAGTPAGTIASTATYVATAPATGSIVFMRLLFDGSSVTVDGL